MSSRQTNVDLRALSELVRYLDDPKNTSEQIFKDLDNPGWTGGGSVFGDATHEDVDKAKIALVQTLNQAYNINISVAHQRVEGLITELMVQQDFEEGDEEV